MLVSLSLSLYSISGYMTYDLKNTIWNCPALIRTKSMHLITFCHPCDPSQHHLDLHTDRSCLSDIGFGWPSVSPTSIYMMHHFNQISASKPLQAVISQPFQSRRSLGSFVRIRFLIHTFTKDQVSVLWNCQVSFTYKVHVFNDVMYYTNWEYIYRQSLVILIAIHHETIFTCNKCSKDTVCDWLESDQGFSSDSRRPRLCDSLERSRPSVFTNATYGEAK